MRFRMQPLHYHGPVWEGPSVHPALWSLLLENDHLIIIERGQPPWAVVIGVPHHAGPGVDGIAEDWFDEERNRNGRVADETTGLTGLALLAVLEAAQIPARLVIAAHATDHDPNKITGSPYWESVFQPPPARLLLELHGAALGRPHDLELSAGRNTVTDPLAFGKRLAAALPAGIGLAVQARPGVREAWVFHSIAPHPATLKHPALNTPSLAHASTQGIPALHLEMKVHFREPVETLPGQVHPNPQAWQLCRALARMIAREQA